MGEARDRGVSGVARTTRSISDGMVGSPREFDGTSVADVAVDLSTFDLAPRGRRYGEADTHETQAEAVMGETTTVVLVAERDSEWQGWMDQLCSTGADVRVLAQRAGESASVFAARVRSEVSQAGTIDQAVLVGGLACDPEVLAARALIVRALTSRMRAGRLHLEGTPRTRLAMEALAQLVSDQLQASGVEVVTERTPAALPLAA